MRTWVKVAIVAVFLFALTNIYLDHRDTVQGNCKPTGVQRMVNTIDGLKVEDQLRCDGGRIKWDMSYN